MIAACEDHGYLDVDAGAETCPVCGREVRRVLGDDRRLQLSKYMSGALRHFPVDAGIDVDRNGWTEYESLVEAVISRYDWATPEHVAAVVATDPKRRYERSDARIRATYGHSIDVDIDRSDDGAPIPDQLYHGTDPQNLPSIASEGLRPMNRQKVHLSGTQSTAREVGQRHTDDPVILVVDTGAVSAAGYEIARRGQEVYTTDRVPPDCLSRLDDQTLDLDE